MYTAAACKYEPMVSGPEDNIDETASDANTTDERQARQRRYHGVTNTMPQ